MYKNNTVNVKEIEESVMYTLVDNIIIHQHDMRMFTCPIESIAIFAHDQDIQYQQVCQPNNTPNIIKLFDDCNSMQKV